MTKTATIEPTVGRVVWVRNRPGNLSGGQPEAATIAYVHSDRCVNVGGLDANGASWNATSVYLQQPGDEAQAVGNFYAEWMPYQKGQAAKTEALEQAIASGQAPQGG